MLKDFSNVKYGNNFKINISRNLPEVPYIFRNYLPMSFWMEYPDNTNSPVTQDKPFTLLINPNSLNIQLSKKVNPTWTRRGYVVEQWGEYQDVLSCSGRIGAYFIYTNTTPDNIVAVPLGDYSKPKSSFGYTDRFNRWQSSSYRNLYSLVLLYRNNGYVYTGALKDTREVNQDTASTKTISSVKIKSDSNVKTAEVAISSEGKIDKVGDVFISYDGNIYRGSFDEFSIEEIATSPYNVGYNFKFTVRETYSTENRKNTPKSEKTLTDTTLNTAPKVIPVLKQENIPITPPEEPAITEENILAPVVASTPEAVKAEITRKVVDFRRNTGDYNLSSVDDPLAELHSIQTVRTIERISIAKEQANLSVFTQAAQENQQFLEEQKLAGVSSRKIADNSNYEINFMNNSLRSL